MPITKRRVIDKIELVGEHRLIQVRWVTLIEEDGKVISKTYDRGKGVMTPDTDITDEEQDIRDVANLVWTPERIQDWNDHKAAIAAKAKERKM